MKITSLFIHTLLFPILLLATPNDKDKIKFKITYDDNITYLKFRAKSPMIGEERYNNQKGLKKDFISHISIINKQKNKKILDISTSSYLSQYPMVKFKYIDMNKPEDIKLIITNNKGTQYKYNATNKRKIQYLTPFKTTVSLAKVKKTDYRKQHSHIFKSRSINEAINALYCTVNHPIKNSLNK